MKKIISLILLMVVVIACDDNPTNNTENICYTPAVGDKFEYFIYEGSILAGIETDSIIQVINHNDLTPYSEYIVLSKYNNTEYEWKWLQYEGSAKLILTANLNPIFSRLQLNSKNNISFSIPYCGTTDYTSEHNEYENSKVLLNDTLVNVTIKYVYKFKGYQAATKSITILNKTYEAKVYQSEFSYQEELVEPANVTFTDGQRIRNVIKKDFELWMSNSLGLVRVVEDGGIVKSLKDYSFAPRN